MLDSPGFAMTGRARLVMMMMVIRMMVIRMMMMMLHRCKWQLERKPRKNW